MLAITTSHVPNNGRVAGGRDVHARQVLLPEDLMVVDLAVPVGGTSARGGEGSPSE